MTHRIKQAIKAWVFGRQGPDGIGHHLLYFGYQWVKFVRRQGRPPQRSRRAFNDFLFYRKVGGTLRSALCKRVTDKHLGKQYIESKLGPGHVIPTLALFDVASQFQDFTPPAYPVVLKPTHSSGRIQVVHDLVEYQASWPVLAQWLTHDYYLYSLEGNYAGLAKRVIAEPFLDPAMKYEGSIHCLGGHPKVVTIIDRFGYDKPRATVDREWNHLHVALGHPYKALDLPRPDYLDALLADAATLAADFDYVRVDFYASENAYVFGELTHLPAGGKGRFSSVEGEQRFSAAFFA